ncbi:uncharacterized protein [Paramisgurnus dabryanus]|uniref:uncharacterized protein n=1 Tax=Paramisgurnus dabryanus TaxID=90735 RepID=UPI0031F3BF5B
MSLILNDEMAADSAEAKRRLLKELVNNKESLKTCGILLINHVIKEYKKEQNLLKPHVNEILHSIFFLGILYHLTPNDFLSVNTAESLNQIFPDPFKKYKSHLPKRTPFSVLLDIMVLKYDTEERVMEELCSLLKELKFPQPLYKPGNKMQNFYTLESTAICVCFNSHDPSKVYFGASLGCRKKAKSIMIYSSCINTWHDHVSNVVMAYSHQQQNGDDLKLWLPRLNFSQSMKCQAYLRDWSENKYIEILPCLNCQRMFSLPGEEREQEFYPYGNCAETECLSKLLLNDDFMQENTDIENYSQEQMADLKTQTINTLRKLLASIPSLSKMNRDVLPVFIPDS